MTKPPTPPPPAGYAATRRDLFIIAALQGLLAQDTMARFNANRERIAVEAILLADAVITVLDAEEKE